MTHDEIRAAIHEANRLKVESDALLAQADEILEPLLEAAKDMSANELLGVARSVKCPLQHLLFLNMYREKAGLNDDDTEEG